MIDQILEKMQELPPKPTDVQLKQILADVPFPQLSVLIESLQALKQGRRDEHYQEVSRIYTRAHQKATIAGRSGSMSLAADSFSQAADSFADLVQQEETINRIIGLIIDIQEEMAISA